MKRRSLATLAFGGALLAAAMLAACGGGSTPGSLPSTGNSANGSVPSSTKSGVKITLKIHRATHSQSRVRAASKQAGRERPQYISQSAMGLQLVISANAGAASQTIYADISQGSPLCSPLVGNVQTCTIVAPILGTSETFVATELDQKPVNEANGYGSAPTVSTNVLAVGTASTTVNPGTAVSISLGLSPVVAKFFDAGATTAGFDFGDVYGSGRIVVTGNTALGTQGIAVQFNDASNANIFGDPTPLPFVDVNGSPQPVSVTVSPNPLPTGSITLAQYPLPSGASASTSFSIGDDSDEQSGALFLFSLYINNLTAPATITFNNNLSALNNFLQPPAPYGNSLVYNVVPISATAPSGPISVSGDTTATVTGSDYLASAGMDAESAYNAKNRICLDANGTTTDATVASTGAIDTTHWTQTFTITPNAAINPLAQATTCTFVLYDLATGVVTQPITVTVNP
jgi:hypothetical protein